MIIDTNHRQVYLIPFPWILPPSVRSHISHWHVSRLCTACLLIWIMFEFEWREREAHPGIWSVSVVPKEAIILESDCNWLTRMCEWNSLIMKFLFLLKGSAASRTPLWVRLSCLAIASTSSSFDITVCCICCCWCKSPFITNFNVDADGDDRHSNAIVSLIHFFLPDSRPESSFSSSSSHSALLPEYTSDSPFSGSKKVAEKGRHKDITSCFCIPNVWERGKRSCLRELIHLSSFRVNFLQTQKSLVSASQERKWNASASFWSMFETWTCRQKNLHSDWKAGIKPLDLRIRNEVQIRSKRKEGTKKKNMLWGKREN